MRRTSLSLKALFLLAAWSLAGCTSPQSAPSLYEQLGGAQAVDAIAYGLIVRIAKDERVVDRFRNVNIGRFKSGLATYICSVSDGPCDYTGDSMRAVHAGHQYTDTEFNAIVELLIEAMEAQGVPVAAQNRLLARLAPDYGDIVYR